MSRAGYSDDLDNLELGRWRGRVASAIRGNRGQAFLQEMLEALDAMPEKRLIADDLENEDGAVCAIGSVGAKRGVAMSDMDPEDHPRIAKAFGIAMPLVREIEFMNDEFGAWKRETPEQRWIRMRRWVVDNLKDKAFVRHHNYRWHMSELAHRVMRSYMRKFVGAKS